MVPIDLDQLHVVGVEVEQRGDVPPLEAVPIRRQIEAGLNGHGGLLVLLGDRARRTIGVEARFKSSPNFQMSGDWPELTIGEVAQRAGVATSAIRYYERVGLLPPPERVSGQRRYDDDVLGRLAFIAVAQNAGFSLREIRELVSRTSDGDELSAPMRELSERKLPEVRAALERARAMQTWLEVAAACDCASTDERALFPPSGDEPVSLAIVRVPAGSGCRRIAT
jgi:MerR family redox-sensitive transcriptional activator SoxR